MMNNRKYNTICSQENIGFSRFYEMIFLFSFPKTNYVQIFTLKCAPHSFYMITHSINWGVIKSILKDICIGISHSCLNRHCVLAFLLFCPFHLCLKGKKKKKVKSSYNGLREKTKMRTWLKQWQQEKITQNERIVKIIYDIVTVADIVSCLHDSHPFNWFPCKKSLPPWYRLKIPNKCFLDFQL